MSITNHAVPTIGAKEDSLDSIVDSLFLLVPMLNRNIIRGGRRRSGVSPVNVQFRAMLMLAGSGALPTSEIGRRLGISKPNVTSLVDRLIARGYVVRTHDTRDRRVVNVSVTERGRRFAAAGKRALRRIMKENMSVLRIDDIESLSEALDTCRKIVSKVGEPSFQ